LLVFYAFCLQCAATIAVMRRETNGWQWPLFAWTYMTALGYLAALFVYQLG
jgi:ferrous iron transport protein B